MSSPAGEWEIGGPSGKGEPSFPLPSSAGVSKGWHQAQTSLFQDGFGWRTRFASLFVVVESLSQAEQFLPDLNDPEDDDNVQLLVRLLNVATKLQVDSDVPWEAKEAFLDKSAMILLAKALEMLDHPLPQLSYLEIITSEERNQSEDAGKITSVLFKAMKSGNFSRLEFFRCNFVGDAYGYAYAQLHPHIQSVADSIEAGHVSLLRALKLHWPLSFYSTLLAFPEGKSQNGHLALSKVLGSGHLPGLKVLDLSGTSIGAADCENYAKALKSGSLQELEVLNFQENKIGDRGAKALGDAFASGQVKRLKVLDLTGNDIAEDGMNALATSFEHGHLSDLRSLHLSRNSVRDRGVLSLARALEAGYLNALQKLDISASSCSEKGLEAIVGAFSKNKILTATVEYDWYKFPQLREILKELVKSNQNTAQFLAELQGSRVPANYSKVYLCGNQRVGKTTLRKSMERGYWKAKFSFERRPHLEEDRTRGIDVSKISSEDNNNGEKSITLLVWDMAGQNEYHLVHNAFFPDLSFAEGKATTFVVVCSSKGEKTEQDLEYWLRFIASSCAKNIQNPRHVLVVLNRMHGDSDVLKHADRWEQLLDRQSKKFEGYLKIHSNPFIVDVRKRKFVQGLKKHLLDHSKQMLGNEKVPELCQLIQNNLSVWSNDRKQFPVLCWTEFVNQVERITGSGGRFPERMVEAATKYLNEAGVVIYIDKESPTEWGIPNTKLIVLDPDWFCRKVVGNMFLPEDMVKAGEDPFRKKVDRSTGSISISQVGEFFTPLQGKWDDSQMKDLVRILVWLGLCYKGQDEGQDVNLFFPALIREDGTRRDCWVSGNTRTDEERRWVMGFSVAHQESEIALAPIALWHRFQVELAQTPRFNGQAPDNDFVVGKYFMAFKVDYMAVLIEVNANSNRPTFDGIDIFVKPFLPVEKDEYHLDARKQCQVDLASNLVDTLLTLWNQVCPGVTYMQRVVWPWPASHPREFIPERNVEVVKVKKWVQQHGPGRSMQWMVGFDDTITEDQLLSTKDKEYVLQSILGSVHDKENVLQSILGSVRVINKGIKEAVELRIFPSDMLIEEGASTTTSKVGELTEQPTTQAPNFVSPDSKVLYEKLKSIQAQTKMHLKVTQGIADNIRKVMGTVQVISNDIREVMGTQKKLLLKVQDMGQIFLEDKDRSCPRFIYLGRKDSGAWMRLKEAMSPVEKVHVYFACEAKFDDYGQHPVMNQPGLDVSELKDWAQKILPWLKVSLTVLFISARVAAHVVAPGLGTLIPDFTQWQQASSVSEGIALATGYSQEKLDDLVSGGIRPNANSTSKTPQELYGNSRSAMMELLEKLTPTEFAQKLRLLKVCLDHGDGNKRVAWICSACYEQYRTSRRDSVRDL